MRVAVGLRLFSDDGADTSAVVVEAERLGVDFVWSAEAWGYDAVRPSARSVRIRPARASKRTWRRWVP